MQTLAVPRPQVSAGRCFKETKRVLEHNSENAVVNMDIVGVVRIIAREQTAILGLVPKELAT